jgi:O-phospho-L-seryl-tRNASec:L-selenocysteinyl-tRNA synthase
VGRSGDLREPQPKAAGSSAIGGLVNALLLDLIRSEMGIRSCKDCFLLPMATGMSLTLVMLALKKVRPEAAKYVIWSRIDQKSCFKSIACAGLTPVVIQLKRVDDELTTNVEAMEEAVERLGAHNIVAIMTTTSCFAPRFDTLKT